MLKLYAWEESFENKILAIKEKEMTLIKKIGLYNSISALVWHVAPFLVSNDIVNNYKQYTNKHPFQYMTLYVSDTSRCFMI